MAAPVVINVGFARCGTTAAHTAMRETEGIAIPSGPKEMNAFRTAIGWSDYRAMFTDGSDLAFEATPAYAQRGPDHLRQVLGRVLDAAPAGETPWFLLLIRNPIGRAFSHYWHEISGRRAPFGAEDSVRGLDHPERLAKVYDLSFPRELAQRRKRKMLVSLPDTLSVFREAGLLDRLLIGHTPKLDACLRDLVERVAGLGGLARSRRVPSASSPHLVRGGPSGTSHRVNGQEGGASIVEVPAGEVLLITRYHVELFPETRFDVDAMAAAAAAWTYEMDPRELDFDVADYLGRQADALEGLPDDCFLADCKGPLIRDVTRVPGRLEVRPRCVDADELIDALGADRVREVN